MNINTSLFGMPVEIDELGTRDATTNAYTHALAYLTAVRSAIDEAGTTAGAGYPEHLAEADQAAFETARTGLIAELDPAIAFARTIVDLVRK